MHISLLDLPIVLVWRVYYWSVKLALAEYQLLEGVHVMLRSLSIWCTEYIFGI